MPSFNKLANKEKTRKANRKAATELMHALPFTNEKYINYRYGDDRFMSNKERNKERKDARERYELLGSPRQRASAKNQTRLWNQSQYNIARRRNAVAALNRKLQNKNVKRRKAEYKQTLKNIYGINRRKDTGIFSPAQFGKALANKTRNNARAKRYNAEVRELNRRAPNYSITNSYWNWKAANPSNANAGFLNTTHVMNWRKGDPGRNVATIAYSPSAEPAVNNA